MADIDDILRLAALRPPLFRCRTAASLDGSVSKRPAHSCDPYGFALSDRGLSFLMVPAINLALLAGPAWGPFAYGCVILDVESYALPILADLGLALPDSVSARSGRGGVHVYLDIDPATLNGITQCQIYLDGVERSLGQLKVQRQYVLAPPSKLFVQRGPFDMRVDELPYAWINPPWGGVSPARALPDWFTPRGRRSTGRRHVVHADGSLLSPPTRLWPLTSAWGDPLTDSVGTLAARLGVHDMRVLRTARPGGRSEMVFRIAVACIHAGAADADAVAELIGDCSAQDDGLADFLASADPGYVDRTARNAVLAALDDWIYSSILTLDEPSIYLATPIRTDRPPPGRLSRTVLRGRFDRTDGTVELAVTGLLSEEEANCAGQRQLQLAAGLTPVEDWTRHGVLPAGARIRAVLDEQGHLRRTLPADPAAFARAWGFDLDDVAATGVEAGRSGPSHPRVPTSRRPAPDEDEDDDDDDDDDER